MTIAAFALFLGVLVLCLVQGWSVAWAITGGLVIFFILGLLMGYKPASLWQMAWKKGKTSLIVVRILLLIGVITGLWRVSGTIAICIYYVTKVITPEFFLLEAFLLTAVMSYLLGTSFGVASTAGVIFMALARSGGINTAVAAGAVLSGVYFGDRCSPASSSASLVAAVTGTDLYCNVRQMWKTGALATVLTVAFYAFLSWKYPATVADANVMAALSENFRLTWPALLPAVAMLVLPLLKVPIIWAMGCSILLSAVVAWLVQGIDPAQIVWVAVTGYQPEQASLAEMMSGGGLTSMVTSYIIVMATGLYSGILEGIGVLKPLKGKLEAGVRRIGRLPVMLGTSILCLMVFCNQAVTVILSEQLLRGAYGDREELAMDIENTGITLAGLVPWSIACSIPLAMLGAGYDALPYAALLWLTPVGYLICKHWFYPGKRV